MPRDPSDSYAPDVDLDDSKKWILKIIAVEEQDKTGPFAKPGQKSMVFKCNVYDPDSGVAVIDKGKDELFEYWYFRNDSTFPLNPKTGKIGESREVADAFLGRKTSDDDIRLMNQEGWEEHLVGKMALADLEWYTNTAGYQRLRVLRLKPYTKAERKKVGAARRLDDDNDDS